jgi:hypothetical protein
MRTLSMLIAAVDSATATGLIAASAAVLTAFVTVGGGVLITRLNASVTKQQKKIDEAQKLQDYRRQLVEKRREERRDVYLRWMKAAQESEEVIGEFKRESEIDKKKAFAAMRPLYEAYDELSLLDCPDDLVKLAAKIQVLQRTSIRDRGDHFRGRLLIEMSNRMQADLSRDDDIISPHRRAPETKFDFSDIGRRARTERD